MAVPTRDRQYDVITIGDMCVDLIVTGSDTTPRFGQVEQLVDDYSLDMGGSCCFFACQAAKRDCASASWAASGTTTLASSSFAASSRASWTPATSL